MIEINKDISIGGNKELAFILGPCIIESTEHAFDIAEKLKKIALKNDLKFIFKASFDKANRSSINAFRGPGLEEGLKILGEIKQKLELPILTDIHEPWQAEKVSSVADIIQIPAFLCRQTDLLVAAAKTGKPINVKKGQFLAPWDMKNVVKKIEDSGNKNIILTERGSFFGYNNLVVDYTSIPIMKSLGCPVVFDATHSVQLPGDKGGETGGRREFVASLSKAAVAMGADAIFMEVHENPENAKCDSSNCFYLSKLEDLLLELNQISNLVRR